MLKHNHVLLSTFILILFSSCLYAQTGTITGKISDTKTKESLAGANVLVIELKSVGTAADANGEFKLKLPVGCYSLKISLLGYTPIVKTDVIVKSDGEFFLDINMATTTLTIDQVEVTADYFDKAIIENNLSTVALAAEEIRRAPGSMADFQRILQGMAGVSFSSDQSNELLVRGGSPNENLTILDGMELHSTNHYPNEFNSGGPINMVNVDLIQDIQFSTGGFISRYGDKLSSVLSITSREGTRNRRFMGEANISMAGAGAIVEGSINNGKGSWLISARKSYVDLIAGSVGLTAIPKYYDLQFKAAYDLSPMHKLSWSGIYGNDKIDIEGETDNTEIRKANKTDYVDIYNVNVKQSQWATGLTLRSLWSKKMYTLVTLYGNNYHNNVAVQNNYSKRIYDSNGKVSKSEILSTRNIFNNQSDNFEVALKAELGWNISKSNKLDIGASLKYGGYKQNAFIDADTVRYDTNDDGKFDQIVIRPASETNYDLKLLEQRKNYVYINDNIKLFNDRLLLKFGLRYDYFSYSNQGDINPRFSLSYYFIPNITSVSFSIGKFSQTQSYPIYGDRYQTDINKYLKNSKALHYVLGVEHILREGLKFNLEGYYKDYSDLPVSEEFINYDDRTFRSEKRLNIGKQEIYGLDLLVQQKLVKDFYGTLSFSRMWTQVTDPRVGKESKSYVSEYDFPYVLTIVFGKRFKNVRKDLDELPFYIKYPSYILPISDDMELSARWRYASGRPYTTRIYTTAEQHKVNGDKWTEGTWIGTNDINGSRYPAYHRLDIGINSRFNFETWNLVINLSIQNIYNRKNIAAYQYNSDGTIDNVYQFSLLPVFGLEIEF